jgi:hypothetical protein
VVKDPIVEEIHQTRAALLEEFCGIDGYMRHLIELQGELKDRLVRREPRKPVITNAQKAS